MFINDLFNFILWADIIEFMGACVIVFYILKACQFLLSGGNVTEARLLVANGVIVSLNFKLAGTLIKTIELHSWQQILLFSAIFILRTALKRFFTWEQTRLRQDTMLD
jgi:uncharacterized membrane protein